MKKYGIETRPDQNLKPLAPIATDTSMGKQTSEKQKEPVFVHSGFRTSSTWFWLRLRSATGLKAYYEPYHSAL